MATSGTETRDSRYRGANESSHSPNMAGARGWFGLGSNSARTSTPPGLLRQKIVEGSTCPQLLMRTAVANSVVPVGGPPLAQALSFVGLVVWADKVLTE